MFWSAITAVPWSRAVRLFSGARGWVGVDIGTRAIKLAQVARTEDAWHIVARQVLFCDSPGRGADGAAGVSFGSALAECAQFRSAFRGRHSAAVLPASQLELRSLEIPSGSREELLHMVREELAAEFSEQPRSFTFDFWSTPAATSYNGLTRVTAVAVSTETMSRVFRDLRRAALECQVLDCGPCALARAVALFDPEASEPVAALDLGYTTSSLVISVAGKPTFSRVLRNISVRDLLQPLETGLNLSAEECQQLIGRVGLPLPGCKLGAAGASAAVLQLISSPLETLLAEVRRTLSFLDQTYPQMVPSRVVLFGGGAMIRNLPQRLAAAIELPVAVWSARPDASSGQDPSDALFGVAAALSALAWEVKPCT